MGANASQISGPGASASNSQTSSVAPMSSDERSRSGCPVNHNGGVPAAPDNNLSKERVASNILGRTPDDVWHYPSPSMFYAALQRKNKAENVDESNINTIVAIHNNMNEKTWKKILKYEAMHVPDGQVPVEVLPRLVSFKGRPDELTPKAWLRKNIMRDNSLFDRHDWIVQRRTKNSSGEIETQQVRYVIDYYHSEDKSKGDELPTNSQDANAIKSIEVDARPALDSVGSFFDRIKLPLLETLGKDPDISKLTVKAPEGPLKVTPGGDRIAECPVPHVKKVEKPDDTFLKFKADGEIIQNKCKSIFQELSNCKTEEECSQLSTKMMLCMGAVVCKQETKSILGDLEKGASEPSKAAMDNLSKCLDTYEKAARAFATTPK